MNAINAAITAIGGWVPDYVLTNAMLEATLDTTDEWITTRLGVRERRILKQEKQGTSSICLPIAREICRKRGISPAEIDMLILATSTPDRLTPCTSNIVAHELGAVNAWAFDINLACSGFLAALDMGARYIESGRYKKVMVIGADQLSAFLDYTERLTSAVFGDGGGGVLLEPCYDGMGLIDTVFRTDGTGYEYVSIKAGGSSKPASPDTVSNGEHFLRMDAQEVFRYAVASLEGILNEIMIRNQLTPDRVDWLVPHQANKMIVETALQVAGLHRDKTMINIDRYGNTSAGTIPLCLWDYEKKLKKGDNVLFVSFGAGFTWGAGYLKWGYDGSLYQTDEQCVA